MQKLFLLVFACIYYIPIYAQPKTTSNQIDKKNTKKTFYFSWGYNSETYTHSDIHVSQPSLSSNYTLVNVTARDHEGWNDGIFNKAISIPQYNYRLGYFFDEERGIAFEINFDHTKYLVQEPQNVHIKGTLKGEKVDTIVNFFEPNGFYYYLNNGANFLLFNIVKRWHLVKDKTGNIKIDLLAKAGIGPLIPHVENSFFGNPNDPHFQIGGWNVGMEGTVKLTFYNRVFLEYCNKLDYARYSGLKIYEGKVHQAFGTYEMILNLGIIIPGRNSKSQTSNSK